MRKVLVAAAALLAGCAAPGPGEAPDAAVALVLSEAVRVVDAGWAREPAIAQTPDGTLWVAGYPGTSPPPPPVPPPAPPGGLPVRPGAVVDFATTPPGLWASRDAGATWAFVDTGTPAEGALGNSDVDLAVGPEGTLYLASMTFSSVGHSIAVGATDDGAAWRWSLLTAQPGSDRPWVEVGPDGAAHAVWNDGAVVHHAASADRGASWQEGPPVHVRGGDGGLAISPEGALAVRIIPASGSGYTEHEGQDGVAVSEDGGVSWRFQPLPGNRTYQSVPEFFLGTADSFDRWADPVAFDAAGTLYAAWGEGEALLLARSRDLGASWDVVPIAAGQAGGAVFPHLRAHPADAGTLAVTWFTRGAEEVRAHVGLLRGADGAQPAMRAAAFAPDTAGDTAGEYFQVAFLHDGALGFATPVQTEDALGFEYRTAR